MFPFDDVIMQKSGPTKATSHKTLSIKTERICIHVLLLGDVINKGSRSYPNTDNTSTPFNSLAPWRCGGNILKVFSPNMCCGVSS